MKLFITITEIKMYLPRELQKYIQDYARPVTRWDWKLGCAFHRTYHQSDGLWIDLQFAWIR